MKPIPAHIEQELTTRWRKRGMCEIEIIALMELFCELREIQKEIVKQKGFIFQDKKAA